MPQPGESLPSSMLPLERQSRRTWQIYPCLESWAAEAVTVTMHSVYRDGDVIQMGKSTCRVTCAVCFLAFYWPTSVTDWRYSCSLHKTFKWPSLQPQRCCHRCFVRLGPRIAHHRCCCGGGLCFIILAHVLANVLVRLVLWSAISAVLALSSSMVCPV